MKVDWLRSLLAQKLPALLYRTDEGRWRRWLWRKLYLYYAKGRLPIRVQLHGRTLVLNAANPYPFILADAPLFNSGLVAAATCLRLHLKRPLRIVDVGASIGDTIVLLNHCLPGGIESCLCIDGEKENQPFFLANTNGIPGISMHFAMLSARVADMPSLIRHHPGTAMAAGDGRVPSETLDRLLAACGNAGKCDLLKIDVDGGDGEVLLGAGKTLLNQQPLVIFEWHPFLIQLCGNDHCAAFSALAAAGYSKMLWFSNRGVLSHLTTIPTRAEIDWWRDLLVARNRPLGPHFDIIAFPPAWNSLVDTITQAAAYPPCPDRQMSTQCGLGYK